MSAFVPTVPLSVGHLREFVEAGVLGPTEVQLAATVARLQPDVAPNVLLGLAVAARGPGLGHVCIDLRDVARLVVDRDEDPAAGLIWPDPDAWNEELATSPIVGSPAAIDKLTGPFRRDVPPLVLDGDRLYLQRYYAYERAVAASIDARAVQPTTATDDARLVAALDSLFGPDDPAVPDLQRRAAEVALTNGLSIIAGGPGTGKTRTIARLLAAAHRLAEEDGRRLDIALAAPTGKAAARMTEAVRLEVETAERDGAISAEVAAILGGTEATTMHKLLGWAPGTKFRHDRRNPLQHDVVIIDETSMAALPLMSHLLDAVKPDAKLVLVGDPSQLASVEAGTVLADLVGPAGGEAANQHSGPLAGRVTVLRRVHRFGAESTIARLADAIRLGATDGAIEILRSGADDVEWIADPDSAAYRRLSDHVVGAAVDVVAAATAGDVEGALDASTRIKVLAATRHGRLGLNDWSARIERGVMERVPKLKRAGTWYVGRPIMVLANDPLTNVANGDVGVVVATAADGGRAVAFRLGPDVREVPTSRLDRVETWWAMTIHKSQGSEFSHAVVSLPAAGSPILTRELLYTAVTRGRTRVTLVADEAAIRQAIDRPVARASGLRERVWSQ